MTVSNFSGKAVEALQTHLNLLGYKMEISGQYGPKTEEAIKDIQSKYNLEVTGIAFEETLKLIEELLTN